MLLTMEYEEARKAFRELGDRQGVLRLVERGKARWPLVVGRNWYNSLNQRVVEVTMEGDPDEDDGFEYGRPVSFFTVEDHGDQKLRHIMTGTVNFVDGARLAVAISDSDDPAFPERRGLGSCFPSTRPPIGLCLMLSTVWQLPKDGSDS